MGHMFDIGIRCLEQQEEQVQLHNKEKFAKLRSCCQSLEKHLYFPRKHFLIIMEGGGGGGGQYKGLYLEQYSS